MQVFGTVGGALTKTANFSEWHALLRWSGLPVERAVQRHFRSDLSATETPVSCLSADVHGVIGEDKTVHDMHANAEQFDRKTEVSFKYLQVRGFDLCLEHVCRSLDSQHLRQRLGQQHPALLDALPCVQ